MKSLHTAALHAIAALALAGTAVFAHATDGEIKKIDMGQGKVTIKHGEIKNLDMPAMTMVFRVRPVTLLNGLAEGDRITFAADKVEGQYVVTAIEKSK
ncbi:MAG TPA: copper-binding protein [Ideonella sp.]|nr:copper-binding protein [Ideonella sp.]